MAFISYYLKEHLLFLIVQITDVNKYVNICNSTVTNCGFILQKNLLHNRFNLGYLIDALLCYDKIFSKHSF